MKWILSIIVFLFCFFSNVYSSTQVKILIISSNELYNQTKYELISGIKKRLSYYGHENIIIKTISYNNSIIFNKSIDDKIEKFNPNFIVVFDKPIFNKDINKPIYNVSLYDIKRILEKILCFLDRSNIKNQKFIVLYDKENNLSQDELKLINDVLQKVEMLEIKTILELRDNITKYQTESNIIYINLLRKLYNIDTGRYSYEADICREFKMFNMKHLDISFKNHVFHYGMSISVGYNNFYIGEGIIDDYIIKKPLNQKVFLNINNKRIKSLGFDMMIYDSFDIIDFICEH